jgi:hypothetical protein
LAINIEGKIGQLTVRRTSSFIISKVNILYINLFRIMMIKGIGVYIYKPGG